MKSGNVAGVLASAVMTAVFCAPAFAQADNTPQEPQGGKNFPIRLALTPYIGLLIPTRDLIEFQNKGNRLSISITWGGRLGISIGQHVQLDGDLGYSPGSLVFSESNTDIDESVHVLSGGGRFTIYPLKRSSPFWIGLTTGVRAVRHTFTQRADLTTSKIEPGTHVGALVGITVGVRLGRVIAVNLGAEDHFYTAAFDIGGVRTSEQKQHDIRLVGGIHIPFLGF